MRSLISAVPRMTQLFDCASVNDVAPASCEENTGSATRVTFDRICASYTWPSVLLKVSGNIGWAGLATVTGALPTCTACPAPLLSVDAPNTWLVPSCVQDPAIVGAV